MASSKPVALSNRAFPLEKLGSREFEELIYNLYDNEVKNGDWNKKYDEVIIMQGVGEGGRDIKIIKNGNPVGLIQCKHSTDSMKRIGKTECAKEIIKFVLNYLVNRTIIKEVNNFDYYFSVSYGFKENAIEFLEQLNTTIANEPDLQKWTEQVITQHDSLSSLNYADISSELLDALQSIQFHKIVPQDINVLLTKTRNQSIVERYFSVRSVTDNQVIEDTKNEILALLDKHQVPSFEKIESDFNAASIFLSNYQDYFEGLQDSHLERLEKSKVLDWIKKGQKQNKENDNILILCGDAGCGKTVLLKSCYLKLRDNKIPVLALKSDRLYEKSLSKLFDKINLQYDIESAIKRLLEKNKSVVIIIDQLDALSQNLSTNREYLDTYRLLIGKLTQIHGVKVILSVRKFDLKYDPDLKQYEKNEKIEIGKLSDEQLNSVLNRLNLGTQNIPNPLTELLQIPHHLNVFCKIYNADKNLLGITTLYELYNELWLNTIGKGQDVYAESLEDLMFEISKLMHREGRISVSRQKLKIEKHKHLNFLNTEGITTELEGEIQFFHQSFYDYAFARWYVTSQTPIIDFILKEKQSLYIRSALKMVLSFQREFDFNSYLKTIHEILIKNKFRFHLKLLVIQFIGYIDQPKDEEKELFTNIIYKDLKLLQFFISTCIGKEWLSYMFSKNIPQTIITGGIIFPLQNFRRRRKVKNEAERNKQINLVRDLLYRYLNSNNNIVLNFANELPECTDKDEILKNLFYYIKKWDTTETLKILDENIAKLTSSQHSFFHVLETLCENNFKIAQKYYLDYFDKLLEKSKGNPSFRQADIKYDTIKFFEKLFSVNLIEAFEFTFDVVYKIGHRTPPLDDSILYESLEFMFTPVEGKGDHIYSYEGLYSQLINATKQIAKSHPEYLREFNNRHLQTNSKLVIRILLLGLLSAPEIFLDELYTWLLTYNEKEGFSSEGKTSYLIRKVISSIYPLLSPEKKIRLNNIILKIKNSHEYRISQESDGKKKAYFGFGYHKYQFIKAIPLSEIKENDDLRKPFLELERRYGRGLDEEPNLMRSGVVGSPYTRDQYEKMTFENWRDTFKKFGDESIKNDEFLKGGLIEHARAFQDKVKYNAEYFYPFILDLSEKLDVNLTYIIYGLNGLREAKYHPKKFQNVLLKLLPKVDRRSDFRDVIWNCKYLIPYGLINDDLIDFLCDQAANNPDPKGVRVLNDLLTDGINSIRGAAVDSLAHCYEYEQYSNKIFGTFEIIAKDRSPAVRATALQYLAYLLNLDREKAFTIFLAFIEDEEMEEVLKHSLWGAHYFSFHFYKEMEKFFVKTSKFPGLIPELSSIIGIAYLNNKPNSLNFLKKISKENPQAMANIINVAQKNLFEQNGKYEKKCLNLLFLFLEVNENEVSHAYSSCFLHFEVSNFVVLHPFIKKYSVSKACASDPHYYFEFLLKCVKDFPIECIELIKHYSKYSPPNISDGPYYENEPILILIGAYNMLRKTQKNYRKYHTKCLTILDKMLSSDIFRNPVQQVLNTVEGNIL
ncbi:MAG: NACHT domain-containing protein [Bacteroidota bacterium]